MADDIVSISIQTISLIVILTVGILAKLHMAKLPEMSRLLKGLFFSCTATAVLSITMYIAAMASCPFSSTLTGILIFFAFSFHLLLLLGVLATLFVRLYTMFKGSVYEMSTRTWCVLIGLVLLLVILIAIDGILFIVHAIQRRQDSADPLLLSAFNIIFIIIVPLWLSLSVFTVAVFYRNLHHLSVYAAGDSTLNVFGGDQPVKLSVRQKRMVNLTSKYVTLYLVSTGTTVVVLMIFWITTWGFAVESNIFGIFGIDCSINMIALYLQYSFAAEQYERYCSKLNMFCKWTITWNMKVSIRKQSESTSSPRSIISHSGSMESPSPRSMNSGCRKTSDVEI